MNTYGALNAMTRLLSSAGQLGAADCLEVAPPTDSQLLGALEAVDHGEVGDGVGEVRLHRSDRQPHLLTHRLEPLVVPAVRGHRRPSQVDLDQLDAPGDDAEHLVGIERVAPELE